MEILILGFDSRLFAFIFDIRNVDIASDHQRFLQKYYFNAASFFRKSNLDIVFTMVNRYEQYLFLYKRIY